MPPRPDAAMGEDTKPILHAVDHFESSEEEEEAPAAPAARARGWRRAVGPATGALVLAVALAILLLTQPAGDNRQHGQGLEADDDGIISFAAQGGNESGEPPRGMINCSAFPYLKLDRYTLRNLGGKGPDTNEVPGLIYNTQVIGGPQDGASFELHLNVTSDPETYQPQSADEVGFQGKYGSINIKAGSNVTVSFQQYNITTHTHVPFEHFFFTFFDLDQGPDGSASESITVRGNTKAFLANHTEVNVTRLSDGSTRFEATTEGTGTDNPKDPLQLTKQQFRRAVTILVENVDEFSVTLAVGASAEDNPRWFNFRGQPTLLCAARSDGTHFHLRTLRGGGWRAGPRAALAALLVLLARL